MDRLDPRNLRPPADLQELWQRQLRLVQELDRKRPVVRGVTVSTSASRLAHGGGKVPSTVNITPRAAVTVYMPQDPDATYVYLQASGSGTCDVEVVF
jgi:hypothetical protein